MVLVVLVLGSVVLSAVLYVLVSDLLPPPVTQPPPVIGATITTSADGLDWVLTVTTAPSGLSPSALYLQLVAPSGTLALGPTPLSSLGGGNVSLAGNLGGVHIEYQGTTAGVVLPGDRLLIGTETTSGSSTQGYQVMLTVTNGVLFDATLQ